MQEGGLFSRRREARSDVFESASSAPRNAPLIDPCLFIFSETFSEVEAEQDGREPHLRRKQDHASPISSQGARGAPRSCETGRGAGDAARLRKTIQWLEEGARRLREDLANVRTELHEERRASKIAKREFEAALREARFAEAAKYQPIVAELKTR